MHVELLIHKNLTCVCGVEPTGGSGTVVIYLESNNGDHSFASTTTSLQCQWNDRWNDKSEGNLFRSSACLVIFRLVNEFYASVPTI